MANIRAKARETILEHYDLGKLLPQHVQWVQQGVEEPLLFSMAGERLKTEDKNTGAIAQSARLHEKSSLAGLKRGRKPTTKNGFAPITQ